MDRPLPTDAALARPQFFRARATCDVENRPSARALEKSGCLREGRLERYIVHPNISPEPRACYLYARCRGSATPKHPPSR
jgi:[ribosomal protein S5]-alanine N-acetyltransferase